SLNTASITTPWISSIRPTLRAGAAPSAVTAAPVGSVAVDASISYVVSSLYVVEGCSVCAPEVNHLRLKPLCAGHDLQDLLRDLGLAGAVHLERELGDEFFGVVRGAAHGGHLRAVEA